MAEIQKKPIKITETVLRDEKGAPAPVQESQKSW